MSTKAIGISVLLMAASVVGILMAQQRRAFGSPQAIRSRAIKAVLPTYPPESIKESREGIVVVEVTIAASGKLDHVAVIEGEEDSMTDSVVTALKLWQFRPLHDSTGELLDMSTSGRLIFAFRIVAGEPTVMDTAAHALEGFRRRRVKEGR